MGKGRLEAFSDGVFAIIITIMVLEMKVPHGESFDALRPLIAVFLSYVLSFVHVGIYWKQTLVAAQGAGSKLKHAIGSDWKGKLSPVFYIVGIVPVFWVSWVSEIAYVTVALLWLIPDRRIEKGLVHADA